MDIIRRIGPVRILLLAILGVGILHMILKFHFILWDEAVYIGIGKYLFSLGSVGLFEVIRPPALPVMLGFLWFLGERATLSYDLLILLFSMGNVYMAYLLGKRISGENAGLLAGALLAITPVFLYNSFRIMTGIPSAFFVLISVYLYLEKRPLLAGLFSGLAVMFRFTNGILLPVLFLLLVLDHHGDPKRLLRKSLLIVLGFLVVVSPYLFASHLAYGDPLHPLVLAGQHQYNPVHIVGNPAENLFYYPSLLFWDNMLLSFSLFSLLYISENKWVRYLLLISLVYLVVFTWMPNKQLRFSLPFLPLLAVLSSFGMLRMKDYLLEQRRRVILFIAFSLLILLSTSVSLCKDFHRFDSFPSEEPGIVGEYYRYFEDSEGTILTSDPVPAAYSDVYMVPYYNNITDAHRIYDRHVDRSDYVIFSFNPFPCFDRECEELREELFGKISRNELCFSETYEETKYIFRVSKTRD